MSLGFPGRYPTTRLRRLRRTPFLRGLVAEHRLSPADLIWPLFVAEPESAGPVPSMPGVERHTVDGLMQQAEAALAHGIGVVALFPYVERERKTSDCREAIDPDNLVCRAVRAVKSRFPELGVLCDVALDPFNLDGHDGLVVDGRILNDESVDILVKQALVQAEAGCDILGPSDMMDGRIAAIRRALDAAGRQDTVLLSYAAKYASAFYGPFRDAIGSGGFLKGDKKTYQMDPANGAEALREVAQDLDEGADMVMVKPGLPYLDIVLRVKQAFAVPVAAYQVSGEYAMLKGAARNGWLDNDRVVLESLLAFKRAGADAILTYAALEAAQLLAKE
ncbi:MAG TPA: porphobilinogen synthase [Kiloniellales bacterium]|nr:porphobilinogen synthase [Kiloniellales bacterium]